MPPPQWARHDGEARASGPGLGRAAKPPESTRRGMLESTVCAGLVGVPRAHRAGVAQLVEQLIRNQQVEGSSPFAGSTYFAEPKGLLPFGSTRLQDISTFSAALPSVKQLDRLHRCRRAQGIQHLLGQRSPIRLAQPARPLEMPVVALRRSEPPRHGHIAQPPTLRARHLPLPVGPLHADLGFTKSKSLRSRAIISPARRPRSRANGRSSPPPRPNVVPGSRGSARPTQGACSTTASTAR